MGAKKWSTILKENYVRTGLLWNKNNTLEEEIKCYTSAGFSNPDEFISWSDESYYTLKDFYIKYFNFVADIKTLNFLVLVMFLSRKEKMDLFNFLSNDFIVSMADHDELEAELLEEFKTFWKSEHKTNKDISIEFLWLKSNIKSLTNKSFTTGTIRDLICYLVSKEMTPIVNHRTNLKLLRKC